MTIKRLVLASALLLGVATPAVAASDSGRGTYAAQLGTNAKALYRDIFAAIRAQDWATAAAKLDAMPEGPLHAVARDELYLAKGSPLVDGPALVAAVEKAPDLPQAQQLARLARTRGVEVVPTLPSTQELRWLGSAPRRSKIAGSEVKGLALAGKIVPLLKSDQPGEAEAILDSEGLDLDSDTLTQWQHRIAWSYYLAGDDASSLRLAAKARASVGDWAAQADWVAGLASWRQNDFSAAEAAFASAARRSGDQEIAAGANFWAARAAMAAGQPARVNPYLKAAARNSETFYGMLANERMGLHVRSTIDQASLGGIEKKPNVRAALALAEIGETELADTLIRWQARIGDARDHAALATIAGRMELPATQLWLAHNGPAGAQPSVSARYPAPQGWAPAGGWRVDRSLVYAHALQESQFRLNITSPAGARGLMQVMPGTAAMLSRRRGEPNVGALTDPSINLEYGQSFIETVRDMSETGGLLPKVIAAYNAGPLPVGVWNLQPRNQADPLLYIESIPYWETRSYVTIILRNYWMYQQQAGEKTKSLAALSQGLWPRFPGLPGKDSVRVNGFGQVAARGTD